jgi:hypothetical protein
METEEIHIDMYAMYRRWLYMLLAIAASYFLFTRPVFDFQDDKGILYVRSFSMDQHTFYVTQTSLQTGTAELTAVMSVNGLYYCNKAILYGCVLSLLCFFSRRARVWTCTITAVLCGAYYLLMIYYAIKISDVHYATVSPSWMSVVPAIILELMVLTRQNVIISGQEEMEESR